MRSLPALQLRRLLLCRSLPLPPPPLQTLIPSSSSKPTSHFLSPPQFSLLNPFSSSSTHLDETQSAISISSLLLQSNPTFPPFTPTPSLLLAVLNLSPDAGRAVLAFHQSLLQNPNFLHSDETLSYFVDYFGRRKDFKAAHDVILSAGRDVRT